MYKIVISSYFKKQLKKLVKKNRKLKDVFKNALVNFDKKTSISVGMGVYKIRLQSPGKGKSGGYRLYIFILEIKKILTPVVIYTKSDQENLTINELVKHLDMVKFELEELI